MQIDFPYRGYERIEPLEVPAVNLPGVYEPLAVTETDEESVLTRGFAQPYGASHLRDVVNPGERILVLVDDGTRGTPIPRLLKLLIGELWAAGILDRQIRLLTAQGTHRKMEDAELRQKLGEFYGRFAIFQHDWLDQSKLSARENREYTRMWLSVKLTAQPTVGI
jgi:nickel-dependent lactate racemase